MGRIPLWWPIGMGVMVMLVQGVTNYVTLGAQVSHNTTDIATIQTEMAKAKTDDANFKLDTSVKLQALTDGQRDTADGIKDLKDMLRQVLSERK